MRPPANNLGLESFYLDTRFNASQNRAQMLAVVRGDTAMGYVPAFDIRRDGPGNG